MSDNTDEGNDSEFTGDQPSYLSIRPNKWTRDEVNEWASETFKEPEVSKWLHDNFYDGPGLLRIKSFPGLPGGLEDQLERPIITLGFSKKPHTFKARYNTKMHFTKPLIVKTLYQFESFLHEKGISPHTDDWRDLLVNNQNDDDYKTTDTSQIFVMSTMNKIPVESD